jgi:hypothetical protein
VPSSGELWFDQVLVGRLRDVFSSDGTWYAAFEPSLLRPSGPLERRLAEFIEFCRDWNERQRNDTDTPGPEEFDRFGELIRGGWYARFPDAHTQPIDDAPVFFDGGEVSWRITGS